MKKKEMDYLRAKAALEIRKSREASRLKKATSTISKPPEDLIRESKKIFKKKKREFEKAWDEAKPSINTRRLLKRFKSQSVDYCNPMLEQAMRLLGIVSAVGYANDELSKSLDSRTYIPEHEVESISAKMLRLKMIEIIAKGMELDDSMLDRIIGIQITKDFGTVSGPAPITAPPIQRKKPNLKVKNEKTPSVLLKKREKR